MCNKCYISNKWHLKEINPSKTDVSDGLNMEYLGFAAVQKLLLHFFCNIFGGKYKNRSISTDYFI